jgi:hypothetical protein
VARVFGRILASIWDDQDFVALDPEAQRMFMFLLSQPNLNHAGLLPLTVRRWASKARRLTVKQVRQSLADLDAAGFVVVDEETEELLVRSFVRRDEVYKQPRVMGAAVSGALEISSRRLRRALIGEMDRLPLHELNGEPVRLRNGLDAPSIRAQVEGHIDTLLVAFTEPSGPPSPSPSGGGSPTPAEGGTDPLAEGDSEGGAEGDWGTRARARGPLLLSLSPVPNPYPPLSSSAVPAADAAPPRGEQRTALAPRRDLNANRPDADALCDRLAELMVANGCKPPTVTNTWRTAARLLLDKDERELDKAMRLLEWCQADQFWRGNIQSLPKFREKYDQLRLKALGDWNRRTVIPLRPGHDEILAAAMERARAAEAETAASPKEISA